MREQIRRHLPDLSIAVLVVFTIFGLPIALYFLGVSPSAHWEESVGYRYFHSLRLVNSGETPWLPQGQLAGLSHMMIQLLLTLMGYDPAEIAPRIDLFSLLAQVLPMALSVLAFLCVAKQLESVWSVLALGAATILAFLAARLPHGWTVMPDYHVWVIPLALATIALGLDMLSKGRMTLRRSLEIGLLAGLALSLKPTFMVFPLLLAGISLFMFEPIKVGNWRVVVRVALLYLPMVAVAALVGWMVLFAYYQFDLDATLLHFVLLHKFSDSQASTLGNQGESFFLDVLLPRSFDDLTFLILPLSLLAACTFLFKGWRIASGMLPAILASLAFMATRYYSHTLIEVHALFLVVACFLWVVFKPRSALLRQGLAVGLGFYTLVISYQVFLPRSENIANRAGLASASALQAQARIDSTGGITAILTTNNTYRPNTFHSALCKGGTDIFLPVWGASPYVEAMFPKFKCGYLQSSHRDWDFDNVLFQRLGGEGIEAAKLRMEQQFPGALINMDCDIDIPAPSAHLILCHPHLSPSVLQGFAVVSALATAVRERGTGVYGEEYYPLDALPGGANPWGGGIRIVGIKDRFRVNLQGVPQEACRQFFEWAHRKVGAEAVSVEGNSADWRPRAGAKDYTSDCSADDVQVNFLFQ